MGCLVFKESQTKLDITKGDNDQLTLVQRQRKFWFKSIEQWMNAFLTFTAIYCEKFPSQAPQLMKYMSIIQKLAGDVGERAAFNYDEQFRLWRADDPSSMPWDKTNAELHSEALQMGLKNKMKGLEDTTAKQKPKTGQPPFRKDNF